MLLAICVNYAKINNFMLRMRAWSRFRWLIFAVTMGVDHGGDRGVKSPPPAEFGVGRFCHVAKC